MLARQSGERTVGFQADEMVSHVKKVYLRPLPRRLGVEGSSSPLLRAPVDLPLPLRARRWCSGCCDRDKRAQMRQILMRKIL